jgi:hypothetical protein
MIDTPNGMPINAAIEALVKAQQEMGAVLKNAKNPHLKSKYADLGSVIDATFPALHANGFAVMQPAGMDDMGQFVETHFCHISGKTFSSRIYLVIGKNDMQGVGSAHTYARRYGLLAMAGVAPEDDDGEATKAPKRQDAPPPFNAAACETRLRHEMAKLKTKQARATFWENEKPAFGAIKDADPAAYATLREDLGALVLEDAGE